MDEYHVGERTSNKWKQLSLLTPLQKPNATEVRYEADLNGMESLFCRITYSVCFCVGTMLNDLLNVTRVLNIGAGANPVINNFSPGHEKNPSKHWNHVSFKGQIVKLSTCLRVVHWPCIVNLHICAWLKIVYNFAVHECLGTCFTDRCTPRTSVVEGKVMLWHSRPVAIINTKRTMNTTT